MSTALVKLADLILDIVSPLTERRLFDPKSSILNLCLSLLVSLYVDRVHLHTTIVEAFLEDDFEMKLNFPEINQQLCDG